MSNTLPLPCPYCDYAGHCLGAIPFWPKDCPKGTKARYSVTCWFCGARGKPSREGEPGTAIAEWNRVASRVNAHADLVAALRKMHTFAQVVAAGNAAALDWDGIVSDIESTLAKVKE